MPDLVSIFTNLSKSLAPIQELLSGFGYVLGIALVLAAMGKFHKIGDARTQSHSQEKIFVPVMFLLMGAGLIFLPTTLSVLANTAFGSTNILAYSPEKEDDLTAAIKFFIQTAGVLWFVRGSVLLAHSSEPGVKEGSKGLTFIAAGIFALNFDNTIHIIEYALDSFFAVMGTVKGNATG
ncbi:MAG: type IV secretion protein IcmC [Gammaproteobacteria bacterium]|nr:type IV secretion protein IcmC [Gammaproteobacteria bacterium]